MIQRIRNPYYMADTATASPAIEPSTDTATSVLDYEPDSPASLEALVTGPDPIPAKPDSKPPAVKPEATKPDPKPEAVKPDDKSKKEPAAAQLRQQYEATKSEVAELQKKLDEAKNDQTAARLQTQLDAKEKELEEARNQHKEAQQRLALHDPSLTKELTDLRSNFNKQISKTFEDVPKLQSEYSSLLSEFIALPRGTPEYESKFQAFKESLQEKYPDDFKDVLGALRQGKEFREEFSAKEQDLRTNAESVSHRNHSEAWSKADADFRKDAEAFLLVPEDIAESDPYHPVLFLNKVRETDPDDFDSTYKKLVDFAKRVTIGPKPKTKEDFAGMSDEQAKQAMQEEMLRFCADRKTGSKFIVQGALALRYHRGLVQQVKKLQERLEEYERATPPDPSGSGGSAPAEDDLGSYIPPVVRDADLHRN